MKRLIRVVGAGSAALAAAARMAARTVGEVRDLASGGSSIEVCPSCERAYNPQALANRIRSILGPRNDDSRTVADLIDELCEELDRREPSVICGCGAFNGRARTSCYECGQALPPSEPVRDRQLDKGRPPSGWLLLPEDLFTHAGGFEEAIELAISCTGDPDGYWSHQLDTIRLARIAAANGPDGWGSADLEVLP